MFIWNEFNEYYIHSKLKTHFSYFVNQHMVYVSCQFQSDNFIWINWNIVNIEHDAFHLHFIFMHFSIMRCGTNAVSTVSTDAIICHIKNFHSKGILMFDILIVSESMLNRKFYTDTWIPCQKWCGFSVEIEWLDSFFGIHTIAEAKRKQQRSKVENA